MLINPALVKYCMQSSTECANPVELLSVCASPHMAGSAGPSQLPFNASPIKCISPPATRASYDLDITRLIASRPYIGKLLAIMATSIPEGKASKLKSAANVDMRSERLNYWMNSAATCTTSGRSKTVAVSFGYFLQASMQ